VQLALLLILILTILAPGLLLVIGMGMLLILPAYLMVSSAFTLVLAPQQILAIAGDRRTRRTHACEHATVNVLEEWYGPLPQVGGVATKDGFYLWGVEGFDPSTVFRAAQEGLMRMRRGERTLALHPRCGTSMLAARFVFAAVFLALLGWTGNFTLFGVLLALAASWLLGRRLGIVAQRYFTTSADVSRMSIDQMAWTDRPALPGPATMVIPRGAYFLATSQA